MRRWVSRPHWVFQRFGEVGDEGAAYGVGVGVAFEPGGDGGGQSSDVVLGEQQPGIVEAQAGEKVDGGAVVGEVGRLWLGQRRGRGGSRRRGSLLRDDHRGGCRGRRGSRRRHHRLALLLLPPGPGLGLRRRAGGSGPSCRSGTRLVVRHGPRDDPAAGCPLPRTGQVSVALQLAQGGCDTGLALGEAVGEVLDADLGPGGQRLDVHGQPDRHQRHLAMLGEVIADDRVAAGVPGVDVDDTGWGGRAAIACRGARGRGNLLGIHREGATSSVVRPSIGIRSPGRGPTHVWGCRGEHMPANRTEIQPSWQSSPLWVTGGREGLGKVIPQRIKSF